MAAEYNQDQSTGFRSELDEPRRTTDQLQQGDLSTGNQQQGDFGTGDQQVGDFGTGNQQPRDFGTDDQQQSDFGTGDQQQGDFGTGDQQFGGGYGGVSEQEPPHHKIHSEDEPLPKPAAGTYDESVPGELPSSEPREEQVMPQPTSENYGGAPNSTAGYEEYRDTEPRKFDEAPVDSEPSNNGTGAQYPTGGYTDPSEAFPGAPIDRKLEEPGYGNDQTTTQTGVDSYDPADSSDPAVDSTTPATGAPKKESLINKIKDKLPGHHKSADTAVDADTPIDQDTTGAPPKKGLMTKIKEKLPGHHSTTD